MRSAIALVLSFLLTFAAAAVGSVASVRAGEFYASLDRPSWAPPSSVFGPVWTTLYVLMAVGAWLAWRAGERSGDVGRTHDGPGSHGARADRRVLVLYVVQLALNALWTWLFFGWRQGAWAAAEIVVLWVAIALTLATFWRLRPLAGALLLPYLAWVTFAAFLTVSVWRRNPTLL